jgi:hypothetical protein
MTGAQVKLGVLKPIDLRAILNWTRIYGGQEPPQVEPSRAYSLPGDDFR